MMSPLRPLDRLYDGILADHLERERQMAFVVGPRQVGKTTTCRGLGTAYFDWDDDDHRATLLAGPAALAKFVGLDRLSERPPVLVFDEIHKYRLWKRFVKGFFGSWGDRARVIVTGSSRLDVYRRGGDSLMGRYFLYHMHPLSVGELLRQEPPTTCIRPPAALDEAEFSALWEFGGFPEPFLRRDSRFSARWRRLRIEQLAKEDIRELTRIQEFGQIEVLARNLLERSGSQLVFTNLANDVRVSVDTVRRWVETLSTLHLGFLLRPWFKSLAKSLRKEPKWFLRDWSGVEDEGARAETFVACHLLKAVEGWQDLGLGAFELRYLRDKEKREVDFLVVRDRKPWFLVEVKKSDTHLSQALGNFQKQIGAPHAFQAVMDLDHVDADCFKTREPVVVPARTLLSQIL